MSTVLKIKKMQFLVHIIIIFKHNISVWHMPIGNEQISIVL